MILEKIVLDNHKQELHMVATLVVPLA